MQLSLLLESREYSNSVPSTTLSSTKFENTSTKTSFVTTTKLQYTYTSTLIPASTGIKTSVSRQNYTYPSTSKANQNITTHHLQASTGTDQLGKFYRFYIFLALSFHI